MSKDLANTARLGRPDESVIWHHVDDLNRVATAHQWGPFIEAAGLASLQALADRRDHSEQPDTDTDINLSTASLMRPHPPPLQGHDGASAIRFK